MVLQYLLRIKYFQLNVFFLEVALMWILCGNKFAKEHTAVKM